MVKDVYFYSVWNNHIKCHETGPYEWHAAKTCLLTSLSLKWKVGRQGHTNLSFVCSWCLVTMTKILKEVFLGNDIERNLELYWANWYNGWYNAMFTANISTFHLFSPCFTLFSHSSLGTWYLSLEGQTGVNKNYMRCTKSTDIICGFDKQTTLLT